MICEQHSSLSDSSPLHSLPPVVVTIGGVDPSGGAGLAADVSTLNQLGCHAAPVVTALTVQNTHNVQRVAPVDLTLLEQQIRTVFEDVTIAAVKIGLLSDARFPTLIASILADYAAVPVVLDPVLAAGGGADLAMPMLPVTLAALYPHTTVICPNRHELTALAQQPSINESAQDLLTQGCTNVLVTGADAPTANVMNQWFFAEGENVGEKVFDWPRIAGVYHGTGCTLSSAIAAYLARGATVAEAIEQAQQFTHQAIQQGYRISDGQAIPGRIQRV